MKTAQQQEYVKGASINCRRTAGFTLVEIMFVVLIIGMLLAVAEESFISARANARARACVENLTKIDGAKHQYILVNSLGSDAFNANPPTVQSFVGSYLGVSPACPASGTYSLGDYSTSPSCTFGSTDGTLDAHALPT